MEKPIVFLSGERVYLRLAEESDLPLYLRWVNDPETRKWLGGQFPWNMLAERKWFEAQASSRPPTDLTFAIVLRDGNRPIGNVGLHRINWQARSASTGMVIGEAEERGKGYGPEAKALLLDYAFDTLGLHRISANALATNRRSIGSLRKSGYVHEGVRREAAYCDNAWVDEIAFGILDREWRERRGA